MKLLGLLLVLACVLTAGIAAADEAKKPDAKPITPTMEATLGEYANALFVQRNVLERELAQARAHIKALQRRVEELSKPRTEGKD